MLFIYLTLSLLLAVTSTVTALPTSTDVPIQGVGHASPTQFDRAAPTPEFLQVSQEELAAAIANVTSGRQAPGKRPSSSSPPPPPPVSGRGVIGADNRVYWPSTDYPYSAMGRLYRSDGVVCTGTLIGPRHVTTAKHCIPQGGSVSIKFQPAYDGGDRFPSAYVTMVLAAPGASSSEQCSYKDDWAVVLLDARLGDARGYLGYDAPAPSAQADRPAFYSYGYPSDKSADVGRPYRQEAVTVSRSASYKCDGYGPLSTDADATGGQSGSPLWLPPDANGVRVQYGVMASSSATNTYFAGGEVWAGGIQYMMSAYP